MPADLGVNIDHVATIRQARQAEYPDPVPAAAIAEMAGADQITCHIRMDRRHVNERDIEVLARTVQTRLNVEMAATDEMVAIAVKLRPHQVTLVPEREGEVTTEGGLDLTRDGTFADAASAVETLRRAGIQVSIFADPDVEQVEATVRCGATAIELNTAAYSEAEGKERDRELERLDRAGRAAAAAGLFVAAGHGLHYHNVQPLVALDLVQEYNIGHAIIARAVFTGLDAAVRDMKALLF
jgi:pyridoxine 5-phosphate synthase